MDSSVTTQLLLELLKEVEIILENSSCAKRFNPRILSELTTDYLKNPGKRLRPLLVFAGCGVVGGNPHDVAPVASAYEVFHNWTLVHDDIIDNDSQRRGRPTAHISAATWFDENIDLSSEKSKDLGTKTAILIGDNLHALAVYLFLKTAESDKISPKIILSELRRMEGEAVPYLVGGEMSDTICGYLNVLTVSENEIFETMRLKTGVLFQYALSAGAVLGLEKPFEQCEEAQILSEFGWRCGLAFQLQDDWLSVFGDESKCGKPVGSDLREGKATLLMAKTLRKVEEGDRKFLISLTQNENIDSTSLLRAQQIMINCGSAKEVQEMAFKMIDEAKELLDKLPLNPWNKWLRLWADGLINREK